MRKTTKRRPVLETVEGVTLVKETSKEEIKGTQEYIEKYFPVVKASTLSLEDDFLKHTPKSSRQRKFKELLVLAIESGLTDFRAQVMDPSINDDGTISYKAGMNPAVGKSRNWWRKNSKKFMPEKESRLGTTKEKIAFLALLIKHLIEEGYTVSAAWKAICDQSKELGHYWDSKDAKHDFEPTGSRQVGEWYDLANTIKITIDDSGTGFAFVGGSYNCPGYFYPLAAVNNINLPENVYCFSTGWIVLSV